MTPCSSCSRVSVIVNVKYNLCSRCNHTRLSKQKSKSSLTVKKEKRKGIKKKFPKPTGEAKLFKEIWEERKHECEHCGIPIREAYAHNFAHLKGKGAHSELRLVKDNIKIFCRDCHDAYDCRGKEKFELRKNINLIVETE